MSRARPVDGPTISLFPFLAVLLCTMGALLVLLVLFSRSAQHGGAAEADIAELELAKENLAWRLEQLEGVRDRTADDLAKARLQLAGTEEHTRDLADELERLEKLHAELAAGAGSKQADADLGALEAKLKSARESLDKARAEMATKPPAYAVVPYVGSNGTHRRPLYIECCIDGVFLQPEGIRLNPSDFEGPPGPGNPLASALRAAREHIAKTTPTNGDPAAQPYPLLLVRPSGVMAYYVAREAIQSWGSDFGYQLVDEDWTLQFPPRDPTLAEVEKRAIEESRRRLEWLAQVRPARPARPAPQYRAATTRGGVVEEGGPSVLGDTSRFNWTSQQAAAGSGNGAGGLGDGTGGAAGATGAGSAAGGSPAGRGRPLAASGDPSEYGGDGQAAGDVMLGGGGNGAGPGGHALAGGDRMAGGDRYAGTSRFASTGSAASGGVAGGTATEGADAGGTAPGGTTAGGTAAGAASGNSSTAGGSATASAAGGGGGQGMSGGPAMPGLMQSGGAAGSSGAAGASGASASVSMAQARGKNWASLATQDRPIPLTRPIRLECALDEFRLLDESGRRVQVKIPVGGDTAEAIDPLVQAIHKRVAGWGIAGERMYWKPQLVLSATPDGQSRREDLERLLADSGIDTRSQRPDDEIRDLPPVRRTSYTTSAR
ncbi:MAG: hypothetical protein ACK54F_05490 [Planctomycetia bacterium]|jgi:hypothetical protein